MAKAIENIGLYEHQCEHIGCVYYRMLVYQEKYKKYEGEVFIVESKDSIVVGRLLRNMGLLSQLSNFLLEYVI